MQAILIATVVVAVIGLLVGLMLVTVGKKFEVAVDPREAAVRECLPGNNCGGCGFAGCDALSAAIVQGEAPVNACPVGGKKVGDKIAGIMGVEANETEKKVAFVKCAGDCDHVNARSNYVGIHDCASAVASGLNPNECDHGCLGFGTCTKACPFGAISVQNGVAVVDRDKCMACGKCIAVCPKHLIEILPASAPYAVRCSSKDRGPAVKKACSAGCLGCSACVKQCENDAIHMEGNVAHIDYEKCVGCGKCAAKCPAKSIVNPKG
jgi:Na+-translocating ferredoxin:NAD+ oxidoreductase RNF subunit RnfB